MKITLDELERAIHRVRHEHGEKWEPVPECGCEQWSKAVWLQLEDLREAEAEREFLKPIK